MKFIHLSDLHFHRNKSDNKQATKMCQYIAKNYPEHNIIVTGDIVDDGHEKQFERAFDALKVFQGRIFICPGNHDFGAMGNFYSRERAERFDDFLSKNLQQGGTFTGDQTPVVNVLKDKTAQVMLIALDTNLETDHPFDFACGEVGERQLSALNTILSNAATPGMVKMVFFHHHPFIHNNPFIELQDARKFMRTIYNRVDLLLFGHKHESTSWKNSNGVQYILAADNSPGKEWTREIIIEQQVISVNDIAIQ